MKKIVLGKYFTPLIIVFIINIIINSFLGYVGYYNYFTSFIGGFLILYFVSNEYKVSFWKLWFSFFVIKLILVLLLFIGLITYLGVLI